jgi:hypothetical protein
MHLFELFSFFAQLCPIRVHIRFKRVDRHPHVFVGWRFRILKDRGDTPIIVERKFFVSVRFIERQKVHLFVGSRFQINHNRQVPSPEVILRIQNVTN